MTYRNDPYDPKQVGTTWAETHETVTAEDGTRLPETSRGEVEILGVKVPRLPIAAGEEAFSPVIARLSSAAAI